MFLRGARRQGWTAYVSDLTPDEQAQQQAKGAGLANFLLTDVEEPRQARAESLERSRGQQALLRSFFHRAKLLL